MKLLVDFGNTNVKLITENNIKFFKNTKDIKVIQLINEYVSKGKFSNIIIINVGIDGNLFKNFKFNYKLFTNDIVLNYLDFKKIKFEKYGADRIANIVAFKLWKPQSENFIIFDFGTYLTIDVIENNIYKSGRIGLGISTQMKHFCEHSLNLKLSYEDIKNETNDITTAGQIKKEIIEQANIMIQTYFQKYQDFKIIITGHDIEFIQEINCIKNENLLKNLLV